MYSDVEDQLVAVQAAEAMCKRLNADVVIMDDLSVKPLSEAPEGYLEVIRADWRRYGRYW